MTSLGHQLLSEATECYVCEQLEDPQTIECYGNEFVLSSYDDPFSTRFFVDLSLCIFFILVGGCMSGLTLGLLSIDPVNLEILKKSGDEQTRKYAHGISPLIEHHHLLLVTLLMANAAAMESLPIFLNHLVHPAIAIVISVTAVLIFGEIVPQAICSRSGLSIGYHLRYVVGAVMLIFFVVAYPLSKLLDCIFGHNEGTIYRRAELKELVAIHGQAGHEGEHNHEHNQNRLSPDEITIIRGALDMTKKTVISSMTPIDQVFMLSTSDRFDKDTMQKVMEAGHSRVPVYHKSRDTIIGMLLTKNLLLCDPNDAISVSETPIRRFPTVPSNMPLYDILNIFQTGKSHMATVLDPEDQISILGIITLEDVLEELIQEEILDETDVFVDVVKQIRVAAVGRKLHEGEQGSHHNLFADPPLLGPSMVQDIKSSV